MKIRVMCLLVAFLILFAGCSTVKVYHSNPPTQLASNDYFDVEFEPQLARNYHYFNSFRFVLTNKTDKDLTLDWSKTYYLQGGKKFGQWGWEEMTFEELKQTEAQPQITIGSREMLTDVIFPLRLVGKKRLPKPLAAGEYLAVVSDSDASPLGVRRLSPNDVDGLVKLLEEFAGLSRRVP